MGAEMNDRIRARRGCPRTRVPLHCSSTTTNCAGGSIPKWGVIVSAPRCRLPNSEGFPKFTHYGGADTGRRCRQWLDADSGAGKNEYRSNAEDGPEHFECPRTVRHPASSAAVIICRTGSRAR